MLKSNGGIKSNQAKSTNKMSRTRITIGNCVINSIIIYDVIKGNRIDGDCDDHADGKIRREVHCPMERISGGFM